MDRAHKRNFHSTTVAIHDYWKPTATDSSRIPSTSHTVKMPAEVSDIKQFIEICRRKDAQCTFYELPSSLGSRLEVEEED
jgi:hypothetical protein